MDPCESLPILGIITSHFRVLALEMRGRGASFIGGVGMPRVASCRAARGEAALGVLPATRPLHLILLDFCTRTIFQPDFQGRF